MKEQILVEAYLTMKEEDKEKIEKLGNTINGLLGRTVCHTLKPDYFKKLWEWSFEPEIFYNIRTEEIKEISIYVNEFVKKHKMTEGYFNIWIIDQPDYSLENNG